MLKRLWDDYKKADDIPPEQFAKKWFKENRKLPGVKKAKKGGLTVDSLVNHIVSQKAKQSEKQHSRKPLGCVLSLAAGVLALGYGAYSLFGSAPDNAADNDNISMVDRDYGVPLSRLQSIQGTYVVRSYGESPKVIFIGEVHEDPGQEIQSRQLEDSDGLVSRVCLQLSRQYGIDDIACEGMTEMVVDNYRRRGTFLAPGQTAHVSTDSFMERYKRFFGQHDWNILVSEDPVADENLQRLMVPIWDLRVEFYDTYREIVAHAFTRNSRVEQDGEVVYSEEAAWGEVRSVYGSLVEDYRSRILALADRNESEIWRNMIDRRENYLVRLARDNDGPLIVRMGLAHTHTFADRLEGAGIPYACLALDCLPAEEYKPRTREDFREQFTQFPPCGSVPVNGHFDAESNFILED